MPEPPFRPNDILSALAHHNVEFILIGGIAATLHGSPYNTRDVDICPNRAAENLERLAEALSALDARIFAEEEPDGLPFDRSREMLDRADLWNLITRFGRLDLSFQPSGTSGYRDLEKDAIEMVIRGSALKVASLADVIRSKQAAGRPKDAVVLDTLRRLLDRINRADEIGLDQAPDDLGLG